MEGKLDPDAAIESQKIAADRVEAHPDEGIALPLPAISTVEPCAAFAIESDDRATNVMKFSMFVVQVAITSKCYRVTINRDDAMHHEMARLDFCQHRVSYFRICGLCE